MLIARASQKSEYELLVSYKHPLTWIDNLVPKGTKQLLLLK